MQKSSVNVYAGICKWLKRGAFLQKSIVLKIGKLLVQIYRHTKGLNSKEYNESLQETQMVSKETIEVIRKLVRILQIFV